jgi:GNAT superfamily N-acetyltransferase
VVRLDADWHEDVTLKNGVRVRMRLVRASDREILRRGFERLSPESRYLRFFTEKTSLTERELTYLTDVDQQNHIAIGAVLVDDNGKEGEGVAVARLIRIDDSETAEAAVAVTDDLHGQGLGHVLLERLVEAGLERGIKRVRTEFLERNHAMRDLAEHLGQLVHIEKDSGVMSMEVELTANHGTQAVRLLRLLKLAAQGLIVVVLSPMLRAFGRRED